MGLGLVLVRVASMVGTAPALGNARVPNQVKIGLAAMLTLVLYPVLPPFPADWDTGRLALAAIFEAMVGAALGAAASAALAAAAAAGELLDAQAGLGNATLIDPSHAGSAPQPILASLFGGVMVLVALKADLHLELVRGVALSFRFVPLGGVGLDSGIPLDLVRLLTLAGTGFFAAVAAMTAPILIGMLALEVIGALLSRVLPGLNLLIAMAPARVAAVITLALVALPGTARAMEAMMNDVTILLRGG